MYNMYLKQPPISCSLQ